MVQDISSFTKLSFQCKLQLHMYKHKALQMQILHPKNEEEVLKDVSGQGMISLKLFEYCKFATTPRKR